MGQELEIPDPCLAWIQLIATTAIKGKKKPKPYNNNKKSIKKKPKQPTTTTLSSHGV